LPSLPVHAASFDCKKATTAAEKMICSNSSLSSLDEELAKVYLQALTSASDREALKKEQRDWVKKKRNLCINVDCLFSSYQARIAQLKADAAARGKAPSAGEISGVWEELKPAAGGPYRLIIKPGKLNLSLCNRKTFELKQVQESKYIFVASEKGKCLGYSSRFELNVITITISDSESIHATFYSGMDKNDWLGSNNFFKIE